MKKSLIKSKKNYPFGKPKINSWKKLDKKWELNIKHLC